MTTATASGDKPRALIIGGSMGGVFAAHYLRIQGWDVEIFERSEVPLTGRGAGIITHPELRRALADIGRSAEDDLGIAFDWWLSDPCQRCFKSGHRLTISIKLIKTQCIIASGQVPVERRYPVSLAVSQPQLAL